MNTYPIRKLNLFQRILQVALCLTGCFAGTCFDDFKTPKLLATENESYNEFGAITKHEDTSTIFVGGEVYKDDSANSATILAAINSEGNNEFKWRKLYRSGTMKTVTALAVSPDGTSLAVHGSEVAQSQFYYCCYIDGDTMRFAGTPISMVFTVSTLNGDFKTKPVKITHETGDSSNADLYTYMVWSSGMLHNNDNGIIMAIHNQNEPWYTVSDSLGLGP